MEKTTGESVLNNSLATEEIPSKTNGPYMMLGAGQLCAAVNKEGDEQSGWHYRFNLFRMSKNTGCVEQRFAPGDIADLVKLARVLAFAIADDGCLCRDMLEELHQLSASLDDMLSADWHV